MSKLFLGTATEDPLQQPHAQEQAQRRSSICAEREQEEAWQPHTHIACTSLCTVARTFLPAP